MTPSPGQLRTACHPNAGKKEIPRRSWCRLFLMRVVASGLSLGFWMSGAAFAEIRVVDDFGRDVVLAEPARRILSLAPHITENLFSAGAGDRVVGVVDHSDFPPAANNLPSVGSYVHFNIEGALALAPDLVVAWPSSRNGEILNRLERHGITVYFSEPRTFDGVMENIRELALLAGTEDAVDPRLDPALEKIAEARNRFADRPVLDVFYQIWSEPLITLNGEHFISRILEVCGARNLFADLSIIAPRVSMEAVIEANPDVIITGLRDGMRPDMSFWRRWTMVKAVEQNRFVYVDSDVMHRHTLRMLLGIPGFCSQIDTTRQGSSG
ncbi:MAG: cobalamin-binding protein [Gammaproteobacteria bacterium]|nr:cobalamin-binding protein [Gammaproteobacteria bacterium]